MDERYAETLRKQEEKRKQIRGEKYVATKPKSSPNRKFEKIKDTFITLGCIIGVILIIGAFAFLMFNGENQDDLKKVNIGGVTFNIPSFMSIDESGEDEKLYFEKYSGYMSRYGDYDDHRSYVVIHVYKNNSVEQVFSYYKSNYELISPENITIGNYSGIKFGIKAGGWDSLFVFEKSGKTVVVFIMYYNFNELLSQL